VARLARLKPGSAAKSPDAEARSGHDECRTPLADALVASLSDLQAERIRGGGISADLLDRYGNERAESRTYGFSANSSKTWANERRSSPEVTSPAK